MKNKDYWNQTIADKRFLVKRGRIKEGVILSKIPEIISYKLRLSTFFNFLSKIPKISYINFIKQESVFRYGDKTIMKKYIYNPVKTCESLLHYESVLFNWT